MKALSVRQPWARLIVHGHKDIENRTWPTRFRGRVLVHAGKGMTRGEYDSTVTTAWHASDGQIMLPAFEALERGGIVGAVTIHDCIPGARRSSEWHMGDQYGFALRDAVPIPFIPCRGALGFFDVPAEAAEQVHALAARQQQEGGAPK